MKCIAKACLRNICSFQGVCGVCGGEFPSRSKLFEHIKSSGHAVLKDAPPQQQNTQGKKNKKKKGK